MPRLPGLDLLRALAITWVMIFHAQVGGYGTPWRPLSNLGWMGVDIFFVLSGYLIGWPVLKGLAEGRGFSWRDFYIKRVFRILPAFLAVLGLYALWPAFREAPGMQPLWQFLSFTVNFQIDYAHNRAFSHAWSLCVEEHFYLLFPLLALGLYRFGGAGRVLGVFLLVLLGGMLLRAGLWTSLLEPQLGNLTGEGGYYQRFVEDIYYPTYARLDGLLTGVALAALRAFRPALWAWALRQTHALLALGVLGLAGAMALFQDRAGFPASVYGYPLLSLSLGLVLLSAVSERGLLARLRLPGAHGLALMSYSLYLVHKPAFHLVREAFGPELEGRGVLAFFVYGGLALVAGGLLYFLVERPFLAWRERWLNPATPAPSPLAEAA
ncbi:MAG: acyltransferase [Gammaproteobacteria bacterium]|nr:acyltransferase [Gammaproteobacteria bacterium]